MGGKRTIVSSSQFWDFNENPIFRGSFVCEQKGLVENRESKEKEEKIVGFIFCDEDGEEHLITNAWAINKALNQEDDKLGCMVKDADVMLEIEFLEKIDVKGQPFNRFKVSILE